MRRALLAAVGVLLLQACENVTSVPNQPEAGAPPGWTVLAAGSRNLNAVNGLSDTAVWAVGDQGTILYWNGAALTPETSGTTANLRGVWAVDADHVYAVGDSGTILQRTAGAWTQVGVGTTREVLTGVWADSTQRVVAVGSFGTVVVGAMGKYKVIPNADAENLLGVTGTPGGPAVAVGALGLVLTISTGQMLGRTPLVMGFSKLLTGVATAPGLTYLVGEQGTVFRSSAGAINAVAGFPTSTLRAVSITGTNAWMVGIDGTICEASATATTCFPYSDARWFTGVYAASPTTIWVVGASGTLLHGLPTQSASVGGAADAGGG